MMSSTISESIRKIKRKMIVCTHIGIFFVIASIILGIYAEYWGTVRSYIAFTVGGIGLFFLWRGFCKFCDIKELGKMSSRKENEQCKECIYPKKDNNSNLTVKTATELPNVDRSPTEEEIKAKFQKARETKGTADFEKAKSEANKAMKSYKAYQEELRKALDDFG